MSTRFSHFSRMNTTLNNSAMRPSSSLSLASGNKVGAQFKSCSPSARINPTSLASQCYVTKGLSSGISAIFKSFATREYRK